LNEPDLSTVMMVTMGGTVEVWGDFGGRLDPGFAYVMFIFTNVYAKKIRHTLACPGFEKFLGPPMLLPS
jgi:hypothetical protein